MTVPQQEQVRVIIASGTFGDRGQFEEFARDFIKTGLSSHTFVIGKFEMSRECFCKLGVKIRLRSTAAPILNKAFAHYGILSRWKSHFEINSAYA